MSAKCISICVFLTRQMLMTIGDQLAFDFTLVIAGRKCDITF